MVHVCAGSALLAQTDEVIGRPLWRDLVESIELVLASCAQPHQVMHAPSRSIIMTAYDSTLELRGVA